MVTLHKMPNVMHQDLHFTHTEKLVGFMLRGLHGPKAMQVSTLTDMAKHMCGLGPATHQSSWVEQQTGYLMVGHFTLHGNKQWSSC